MATARGRVATPPADGLARGRDRPWRACARAQTLPQVGFVSGVTRLALLEGRGPYIGRL